MIEIVRVDGTCSCNECHRPNYHNSLIEREVVDDLFDLQIGSYVATLCWDCIEKLSKKIDEKRT